MAICLLEYYACLSKELRVGQEAQERTNLKIEYAYRLLVHDKEIIPLPPQQMTQPNMKHRLAMWVARQLPDDHPLKET
jgi:hypothetical protein